MAVKVRFSAWGGVSLSAPRGCVKLPGGHGICVHTQPSGYLFVGLLQPSPPPPAFIFVFHLFSFHIFGSFSQVSHVHCVTPAAGVCLISFPVWSSFVPPPSLPSCPLPPSVCRALPTPPHHPPVFPSGLTWCFHPLLGSFQQCSGHLQGTLQSCTTLGAVCWFWLGTKSWTK